MKTIQEVVDALVDLLTDEGNGLSGGSQCMLNIDGHWTGIREIRAENELIVGAIALIDSIG